MPDRIIAEVDFVDSARRPVYDGDHGQYVIEDGKKVYGVWFVPPEETADTPLVLEPE